MEFRKLVPVLLICVFLLSLTVDNAVANSASDLIIHHIDSVVNDDGDSYTVDIVVSALSDRNNALTGLTTRDFVVQENGTAVTLEEVEWIEDIPMSVFIVMDMGATMQGERFRLANEAVTNFIKDLYRGDWVAVYAFNQDFREVVPLSDDLNQARDTFENARLSPTGGACMLDAIYMALDRALAQPEGRQAIVVLSSRKDTTTGFDTCSTKTVDQIISLNQEAGRQLPIYTIGIGTDTDEAALQRIAEATNAIYTRTTVNAEIPNLTKAVSNRFASEYRISYISNNSPGRHTLTVQLDSQSKSVDFDLPGLPPVVTVANPSSPNDFEPGPTRLVLSLVERGVSVDSLTFKIDDVAIGVGGKIDQPPYEFEIDFSQYDGQEVVLTIIAQDQDGNPLSETSLELNFGEEIILEEGEEGEAEEAAPPPTGTTEGCPDGRVCLGNLQLTVLHLVIIGSVLIVVVIGIILLIARSKKKRGKAKAGAEKLSIFDEDATLDGFALPVAKLGRLTVLSSDDPLMVGKEFQLTKSPTTIGRSINNDIALPKDSAVSRKHVEIVGDGEEVSIIETYKTLSDGTKQTPTYGTYLNDRKVTAKTTLSSGDEISLGRRTKLRYESGVKPAEGDGSEEVTIDQIQLPDLDQFDDSTRDG